MKTPLLNRYTTIQAIMIIAALLLASFSFAQGINEQVTVVGAYNPVLPEVSKINASPSPDETEVKLPEMTYPLAPVQLINTLEPEPIPPVKLVGEPQQKLYRNYVRAGFGNYTTPYAEIFANSLRSKSYSLGVHAKHLSSSGQITDYPISNNSLNLIQLNARKFTDNHTFALTGGFRRNVVHHYGFDPATLETPIPDEDLKQRFNRINAAVSLKSNYQETEKLNHFADVSFKSVADLFSTRESVITIEAGADKQFQLMQVTDEQKLGIDANLAFTSYKDSLISQRSSLIAIKPFISTTFNQYQVKAGINFSVTADSASHVYLFPFAEASVKAIQDVMVITAGITGGVSRTGFDALSNTNPFVQSVLPLAYTREKFALYGNIRVRAGDYINLLASLKTSTFENQAFFVNDPASEAFNRFTVVYNDGIVFKGRFEAEYHAAEHIRILAFGSYEKFSLKNPGEAWHRPETSFGGDAYYDIQKKIVLHAGVIANGKQLARVPDSENAGSFLTETIKGYTDVNLGAEYRYTKLLSAFVNFSNILGTRYYMWYNYPSYRFQVMAGLSYSF